MITRTRFAHGAALALAAVALSSVAAAQYAFFDADTDTISVPGDTVLSTAFTAEARVFLCATQPPTVAARLIFQEQFDFAEDKALYAGTMGFGGSAWRTMDDPFFALLPISTEVWHHVAFVYDGAEERLYLDGVLVSNRARSGPMANTPAGLMSIGAFQEPAGAMAFRPSFLGFLDTVRVSNVVRYAGPAFAAPQGDLSSDAGTLLLYNFDQTPGSARVLDSGPNGWHGVSGVGFAGATSPTIGFGAGQVLRNSAAPPANAFAWFQDPFGAPTSGDVWMPVLDGSPLPGLPWFPPLGAGAMYIVLVSGGPAMPDVMVPLAASDPWLLCSLATPPLILLGPFPVMPFVNFTPIPVPASCGIAGLELCTQAVVLDPVNGLRFSNALDVRIGI